MTPPGFGRATPQDLLTGLTPDERQLVGAVGHRRRLPKGAILYKQGDPPGWTYILNSGMIRTYRTSRDGREFTVGFWREHDVIGGPDIFSTAPRWLSAQTTAASVLTGFSSLELDRLIAEIPRFAHNLIAVLSFKSRWMMNTGDALGTGSVAQRIAHVILLQAEVHGSTTGEGFRELTHMSHRDLATLVGASRQWVTQALADLQRRDFVRVAHRRITVVDEPGLQRLAQL
jgi:CRP-like cAMP-binding protein